MWSWLCRGKCCCWQMLTVAYAALLACPPYLPACLQVIADSEEGADQLLASQGLQADEEGGSGLAAGLTGLTAATLGRTLSQMRSRRIMRRPA